MRYSSSSDKERSCYYPHRLRQGCATILSNPGNVETLETQAFLRYFDLIMSVYDHAIAEKKWQERWEQEGLYSTSNISDDREHLMVLTEFPYPSGNLHMGHWYAFSLPDAYARFMRMQGKQVVYPIGFDAFGLPAENAAIKHRTHPRAWTEQNIETMTGQLKSMGASFDWSRAVSTIDPDYYRWTQWMFIRFFEKGLAYRAKTMVNWCPTDKTVLANEQVVDGKCERDDTPVEQREIEQWMLKTTAYASELVQGLEGLDWPEATKTAQRNWIGRSEGAEVDFSLRVPGQEDGKHSVTVFTTRPDTLFGCTFLAISPELAKKWLDVGWNGSEQVRSYVQDALSRRELERMEREKTGVSAGITAVNPINGEEIPVWIADYVLGAYGTGAIMAVPAHDERDMGFAQKYGIPVRQVIEPSSGQGASAVAGDVYDGPGILIDSEAYTSLVSDEAKQKIIDALERDGVGRRRTTFRLHDWVLSRQRYWGCPIPLIKCASCGFVPVPDEQLPVRLPELDDFRPADDGRSPLARDEAWVHTDCPQCGKPAERETDTMDTFVDSSWYFIRYTDPKNAECFADPERMQHWLPVGMYVGGAEHNTMHLLYSRFWARALHALGLTHFAEPFTSRRNHGIILGPDGQKMSKSRGNVIDPDELVREYGADTVRLYLAFMAPYEQGGPWDPKGINGVHRFLKRFWRYVTEAAGGDGSDTEGAVRAVHAATKDIGQDLAVMKFNTVVSALMIMLNDLEQEGPASRAVLSRAVQLLAPLAPHMAEELWREALGHEESVHLQPWPVYDEKKLVRDAVDLPIQVNGKLRGAIRIAPDAIEEIALERAREHEGIARYLVGVSIAKVIYIPGRMLNILIV